MLLKSCLVTWSSSVLTSLHISKSSSNLCVINWAVWSSTRKVWHFGCFSQVGKIWSIVSNKFTKKVEDGWHIRVYCCVQVMGWWAMTDGCCVALVGNSVRDQWGRWRSVRSSLGLSAAAGWHCGVGRRVSFSIMRLARRRFPYRLSSVFHWRRYSDVYRYC